MWGGMIDIASSSPRAFGIKDTGTRDLISAYVAESTTSQGTGFDLGASADGHYEQLVVSAGFATAYKPPGVSGAFFSVDGLIQLETSRLTTFAQRANPPGSILWDRGNSVWAGEDGQLHEQIGAGTTWTIPKFFPSVRAALSFGAIPANSCRDQAISVASAATTNVAFASPNYAVEPGLSWSAFVSSPGTVTVRVCNVTPAAIKPAASAKWRVWVTSEAEN